jgi:RimJ/RimL family protein N-acetyltransferase
MEHEDISRLQNPFVIGERLYLRPLEPAQDNHLYSTWVNDPATRRSFSIYPTSDARGKERLDQLYRDSKHIMFGVALKSNNRLIGVVGLTDIDNLNQNAEFYNIIDRRFWHQGYGTESTMLMLQYGFMELNLNRIQTQDMEENIGGQRTDEKCGLKYEGVRRQVILRHGKWHNVRVYGILREEYLEMQKLSPVASEDKILATVSQN